MQTVIAKTFQAALARLTEDEKSRAKVTVYDFQEDPTRPAMKLHRLERSPDNDLWSLRVSDDVRIIVRRRGEEALFAYVDHHDAAYRWAERRRFITHPSTGALQVVETVEVVQEVTRRVVNTVVSVAPLFVHHENAYLLRLGVPEAWLDTVRGVGEDGLLELTDHLPEEAMENLVALAIGDPVLMPEAAAADQDPLQHPDARRRFTVVGDDAQLRRVLEQPLESWLVYLHPSQRAAVERSYRGPAKVTGGAGTGKTVVALHRAARLAESVPDPARLAESKPDPAREAVDQAGTRVLLTTFTRALAGRLAQNLDLLLEPGTAARQRVRVEHLHAVAHDIVSRGLGRAPTILDDRELRRRAEPLLKASGTDTSLTFVVAEFQQVIDPLGINTVRDYILARREGAGSPLRQGERLRLWRIFGPLLDGMERDAVMSFDRLCHRAATILDAAPARPVDHVVVDETQDLGPVELDLVRALVEPGPDDVFLCGDTGQRIYRPRTSFARHGLEVRGRSTILRLNYRTTEQIRRYADALHTADDLEAPDGVDLEGAHGEPGGDVADEADDTDRRNVSLLRGPKPWVMGFLNVGDETDYLAERLRAWVDAGLAPGDIAMFARTHHLLQQRAAAAVRKAGFETYELSEVAPLDPGRVALGTMHNAKGLEFRAVAVVGTDADQLPQRSALFSMNTDRAKERFRERERNLLYVACTRAREELVITHVGPGSEFLRAARAAGFTAS